MIPKADQMRESNGRWVLLAIALGTGSSLAACSSNGTSSGSSASDGTYMTAAHVASKLSAIGCSPTKDTSTGMGIKPVSSLTCTIDGENVTVQEYRSAEQVASQAALAKGFGCTMAKSFGVTSFSYVQGNNWIASAQTKGTVEKMQSAIGAGDATSFHC